jgi:hypothetical protein
MKAIIVALITMLCVPAYGKILETKTDPVSGPYRYGDFVALNIDLGYGKTSDHNGIGMIGIHPGWFHMTEPSLLYIGPSIQLFNNARTNFGVQAEAKNLWMGVWGQLGVYTNTAKQFIVAPSAGFSFIGAELQAFDKDKQMQWRFIGKLQLDVGLIAIGLLGE